MNLETMFPELKRDLYIYHLELSSLCSLHKVSRQFYNEITELIVKPTILANTYSSSFLGHLDQLLAYSREHGNKVKWLRFRPGKFDKPIDAILPTIAIKIIDILKNCPNLAYLYIKPLKNLDEDMIDESELEMLSAINKKTLPLLESLSIRSQEELVLGVLGERSLSLNLSGMNRLNSISLKWFDLNANDLAQINSLPNCHRVRLKLHCQKLMPALIRDALTKFKPTHEVCWEFYMPNFHFPATNLWHVQKIPCQQTVKMGFYKGLPNDRQIRLLKPFKKVSIETHPQIPEELIDRIKFALPESIVSYS